MDIEGAIFLRELNKESPKEILFFDEPTEKKRLWESVSWDSEKIRNAGFRGEIKDFDAIFVFLEEHSEDTFYLPYREEGASIFPILENLRMHIRDSNLKDASQILLDKRIKKSGMDISHIQKAISITKRAFDHIKTLIKP